METQKAEPFDPSTGEIIEPERAADGRIVPSAAFSTGQFLDQINDGAFSHEAYAEVRDLGTMIREMATAQNKKVKGSVTITIDMESEGEFFRIQPKIKVKKPEEPRPVSAAWQDDKGNFTRFPPKQMQMFGVARGPVRMS